VNEASGLIPSNHQTMLLSILDLEKIRVDHIMIPRNEVVGLDLTEDTQYLLKQLQQTQHTLLPVFRSDLDNVQGIIHVRTLLNALAAGPFDHNMILNAMEDPYFVPEGTSLHTQLLYFQRYKKRMALVVDEYGDIMGLVTLEDILEEIVGEFTTDTARTDEIRSQDDGSFLIDGSISMRELNRSQHWDLPTEGPTTLSGLIIETLEAIPKIGTHIMITHYRIEVIEVKDNMVKLAKITP
jgi:Mg2+/Co2+ transporter CorB